MRKLVWFVLGLVAGIFTAVFIRSNIYLICSCLILFVLGMIFRFCTPDHTGRKIAAYLMIGCAAGMCLLSAYSYYNLLPAKELNDTQDIFTVRVADYSHKENGKTQVEGKLRHNNKQIPVKVYIPYEVDLHPGENITGEMSLYYVGYDPQNSDTYHQGNQVLMVAYVTESVIITKGANKSILDIIAKMRKGIDEKINELFPADTKGLATVLLLGDSSGLSVKDDNALKNSGIRHIIAVSGLHVGILCSLLGLLFGNQRWPMALVGIPMLILFAAIAGFTPSIVRACVMQILLLLANLIVEDYDPPTALAVAVALILGADPLALLSVSFQLSVGCVLGIYFFSNRIRMTFYKWKWLKEHAKGKCFSAKLLRGITGSVSVSMAAMSLTIPISAYYFGTVSLVSIFTNMLTLWIMNYVFYGIVFVCIFSFLYTPVGIGIAWLISFLMRYILLASELLAKIPFSCVSAENIYIKIWLGFAYVMFIITLCSKKKHAMILLSCICLSLIGALTCSVLEHRQDRFRITVLDVGQGQCVILQNKNSCYVVDCGGNSSISAADKATAMLRTMGVLQVDGLILTHFDADHAGDAEAFMSQIKTNKLYVPDTDHDNDIYKTLKKEYPNQICELAQTCYLACGEDYLTIYPQNLEEDGNESSMCILFQAEDYDILITGDLDAAGEKAFVTNNRIPDIEMLVCGHHGAKSSSCMEFLQSIEPKTAVISVGKDNPYSHPHRSTLDKLELFECRILRTDINGTIVFRG